MRAMVFILGVVCLALQHACAQLTSDSGVSVPPLESTVATVELEPANDIALASPSRDNDDASATVAPSHAVKEPSEQKADESSSPSSTPASFTQPQASSSSSTPSRESATESSGSHPKPSAKGHRPQTDTTNAIIPRPTPNRSFPPPETPPNHPFPHVPQPTSHEDPPRSKGLSPTAIAFIALGSVVGVFLAYMAFRCCHSWRRAPPPDRINDVVNRHFLDREMEEREREDMHRRWIQFRTSVGSPAPFVPPPPPYIHAPSYEDVSSPLSSAAVDRV